jgi:hypothetical protein
LDCSFSRCLAPSSFSRSIPDPFAHSENMHLEVSFVALGSFVSPKSPIGPSLIRFSGRTWESRYCAQSPPFSLSVLMTESRVRLLTTIEETSPFPFSHLKPRTESDGSPLIDSNWFGSASEFRSSTNLGLSPVYSFSLLIPENLDSS